MRCIQPGSVRGSLAAPASKSMMQRAVLAAALARGESELLNPSLSDDGKAALRVAEGLGASTIITNSSVRIRGGGAPRENARLHCGESGLCLRMTAAISALFSQRVQLTGEGSLLSRPIHMIEAPLKALDVLCESTGGKLPLTIRGPLRGGRVEADGSTSSQFVTGLLMALPCCPQDSELIVPVLRSAPYVAMTLDLLGKFGITIDGATDFSKFTIPGRQHYKPATYTVEGDWSGASFLLVAGALAGEVEVTGLAPDSPQADRAILTALEKVGAHVTVRDDAVRVAARPLHGFSFDAGECPDLFPPLVALAACSEGISRIEGAERLTHKESDRACVLQSEFAKLGIEVIRDGAALVVRGGRVRGAAVSSHNDHRIAMACAVAALRADGEVRVEGEDCVSKSFPDFYDKLLSLTKGAS